MMVVAEATDGAQAVEFFAKHRPDVALLDLRMPVTSGTYAIEAIRRDFRRPTSSSSLPATATRTSTARSRPARAAIC